MSPSAHFNDGNITQTPTSTQPIQNGETNGTTLKHQSHFLHRNLHNLPHRVVGGQGLYLNLSNGQRILDATGGAAVTCLGHGNTRVKAAIASQMDVVSYCHSLFFSTACAEELATELCRGTGGIMTKAFIVNSGSEAMEAAVKLARQYFLELQTPQTGRVRFIARKQSYHGATLAALSVGCHLA